ncbi:hypothetical protein SVIO_025990 [Streptomyces violaceusniger]|uniref:Uncharacterized protein n=1 Tax=Streptomyces violaceusniger TaxID=68280 RepID=A0A4D4KYN9_STRVO|nr:hypothetical protein SVIO_025990 [Streptomyces violaceusniger]
MLPMGPPPRRRQIPARAALPYRNCIKYGMKTFCGPPAHQLRVLLQAIYTTGLRECRPGGYRNSPSRRSCCPDEPDSWSHILIDWKEVYYPHSPI